MKRIYLSGAITGISEYEATEWRRNISRLLYDYIENGTICTYDPSLHFVEADVYNGLVTNEDVMNAELYILRHSDIVIINFDHPDSKGSLIEIAIAYERNIPIFGLNEKHIELHPWQEQLVTKMFDSAEKLVEYIGNQYIVKY